MIIYNNKNSLSAFMKTQTFYEDIWFYNLKSQTFYEVKKKMSRMEMDSHHIITSFSLKKQDFKLKNFEWEILFPFDKSSEYIENQ